MQVIRKISDNTWVSSEMSDYTRGGRFTTFDWVLTILFVGFMIFLFIVFMWF